MQLSLAGINHRTAPVAVREKVAISADRLHNSLAVLHRYVPHGIILSTCNRSEIYAAGSQNDDVSKACIEFLKDTTHLADDGLCQHIYILSGRDLVKHLFEVTCGLDSMVIGEYEVLGQVRQSLEAAEKAGMVNLPLRHIFQSAIRSGRRAREETGISKNALSISSIAVNKALDIIPDINNAKIIIIGAGEAGRLAVKVAGSRGASKIVVVSRTVERAVSLTAELGGRPASPEQLTQELCDANIVITCAASPHPVLRVKQVSEAMRKRPGWPMIVLDIAMPRNVEPAIQEIDNVHLYNIDDLNDIANGHRQQREREISTVEKIIGEEVDMLMKWWQFYRVRPVIKSIMAKAEKIRSTQYNRSLRKLPSLSSEERLSIDLLTRSIVDKLLRDPIMYLRSARGTDHSEFISRLYSLDNDGDHEK
jgi:glutamyl-tRNA reductase